MKFKLSDSTKMVGDWFSDEMGRTMCNFYGMGCTSTAFFWYDPTNQDKLIDEKGAVCHGYQYVAGPRRGEWMSFTYEEALQFKEFLEKTK